MFVIINKLNSSLEVHLSQFWLLGIQKLRIIHLSYHIFINKWIARICSERHVKSHAVFHFWMRQLTWNCLCNYLSDFIECGHCVLQLWSMVILLLISIALSHISISFCLDTIISIVSYHLFLVFETVSLFFLHIIQTFYLLIII